MITAIRYHDFCAGHRVVGHESKCANLHGHNYRVYFEITGELDSVGRVLDFSVIKTTLCQWLEEHWDHRLLIWAEDVQVDNLRAIDSTVYMTPFNPTAENMAQFLFEAVCPYLLKDTGARIVSVVIEETRKCSVKYDG